MQLAVTVDVDAETGLPDGGRGRPDALTSRSERLYGLTRGLPRVLAALDEVRAAATFYVPGLVAERHGDVVAALGREPHTIGHHGYAHLRPDTMSPAAQRRDVGEGLLALEAAYGVRPRGYRAPAWELTPATLDALVEHHFVFDSSLMGDDRPYRVAGGRLLEIPVHWSLDDAPHFAHSTDPSGLLAVWLAELDSARTEHRLCTVTLHPEILGRPHRIDVLRRLLEHARRLGGEIVTHEDVAAEMHDA